MKVSATVLVWAMLAACVMGYVIGWRSVHTTARISWEELDLYRAKVEKLEIQRDEQLSVIASGMPEFEVLRERQIDLTTKYCDMQEEHGTLVKQVQMLNDAFDELDDDRIGNRFIRHYVLREWMDDIVLFPDGRAVIAGTVKRRLLNNETLLAIGMPKGVLR